MLPANQRATTTKLPPDRVEGERPPQELPELIVLTLDKRDWHEQHCLKPPLW